MERLVIVAPFQPQADDRVRELLAAGPPFSLAETTFERHAVYMSSREVVFVFQGPDAEWEVEDLADDFFHPELVTALDEWRTLLAGEPRVGQKVFEWVRGEDERREPRARARTVGELMSSDFVAAAPEDTIGETVEKLARVAPGPALVVDYGRLIGMLTPHDVLNVVAGRAHPSEARVREWMSEVPRALAPDATPEETVRLMLDLAVHELPVVDEGRPVGIVTLRSAVRASAARAPASS